MAILTVEAPEGVWRVTYKRETEEYVVRRDRDEDGASYEYTAGHAVDTLIAILFDEPNPLREIVDAVHRRRPPAFEWMVEHGAGGRDAVAAVWQSAIRLGTMSAVLLGLDRPRAPSLAAVRAAALAYVRVEDIARKPRGDKSWQAARALESWNYSREPAGSAQTVVALSRSRWTVADLRREFVKLADAYRAATPPVTLDDVLRAV